MGATITIENAVKRYGKETIINGLSLEIKPGEFFTLLGPSGCGKTTLLRMIIGFNSIEGGTFKINDRVINNIPTNKRNIGMVFQNYAVFPHMNVFDNVAFGLKNRKLPKEEIEKKVNDILKIVKIDHLKDRMPANLSGGQQQRVALARAIVIEPEVLGMFFARSMLAVILTGCIMMSGYMLVTAILSGVIRDHTPAGKAGHFQGIRMIFGVLLPMIFGPAIGAAVIRGSDSTYVDLGVVKTVPTPSIFLAAAIVLLLILPPVLALKKKEGTKC